MRVRLRSAGTMARCKVTAVTAVTAFTVTAVTLQGRREASAARARAGCPHRELRAWQRSGRRAPLAPGLARCVNISDRPEHALARPHLSRLESRTRTCERKRRRGCGRGGASRREGVRSDSASAFGHWRPSRRREQRPRHGAFSPHARRSGSARRGKGWAVIQGPGANPHGGHYVHIPESTKGKESDGLRAHIITLKAGG